MSFRFKGGKEMKSTEVLWIFTLNRSSFLAFGATLDDGSLLHQMLRQREPWGKIYKR